MPAAKKLAQLLQLADQGPALRAALAEEVAELLTAWPCDYPQSMRAVCEALLAKAAREVDPAIQARLRVQLYADPALSARVLPRHLVSSGLVEAARSGNGLIPNLAQTLGVDQSVAQQILDDDSGMALAAACKGAQLDRTIFSALVLLVRPNNAAVMLEAYENVPMSEASRMLRDWRGAAANQAA